MSRFLLVAVFLVPYAALKRGDSVTRSKRMTNLIGLSVLGMFVIAIVLVQGIGAIKNKAKINDTRGVLNLLGEGFATHNNLIVKKWAEGGYQDAWGGPLLVDGDANTVVFDSKGPDGELGTEDDVCGETFIYEPLAVDLTPIVKPPKKKSLVQKTKEAAEKTKGLWGKAKGLFSKDDKDVDGTNTDSD